MTNDSENWPPIDAVNAHVMWVKRHTFNRLWAEYDGHRRWSHPGLADKGIRSIWNFKENHWFAVHPEETIGDDHD